ncbi:tRNA pseudouridine(13) synthase TruD [Nitratifractor salsuginis]|uniref:tRNA pseudouridine synthase D n=1 Tax=Nitratifractor salsuginis (strain DSM 16511 / JCM 12458 / E9I37-1) TaxID=749222 RepID=E6WYG6_NITSE|nr:tRNA pseudouridine(13) synthase TruD [Nitratifractor salsuginis]ADV46478.1 tRNA pseudouridine synthase D TruD [Nitratifractor salsuginis DSM 16511]
MNHTYAGDFAPFSFRFFQSVERFYVEEIPLAPATGRGEYLLLKLRKQDLSTSRLLNILSAATGASEREIGYAGLKDKAATTIQYFTLPIRYEKGLKNLKTERVELLQKQRTRHPLKTGALLGNRFRIFLDRIDEKEAARLLDEARKMEEFGLPNYFGYQRFGEDGLAWEQGRAIAHSGKRLKGSRERLLVAAWQSRLFNQWLSRRVAASRLIRERSIRDASHKLQWPLELVEALKKQPQFFKLFGGDLLRDRKTQKLFSCKDPLASSRPFKEKRVTVTGLLPGAKVWRARQDARHLEAPYDDEELTALPGDRRDAWIWPGDVGGEYDKKRRGLWLEFTLPPGAYATTLLEELAQHPLAPEPSHSRKRKG